MADDAFHLSSLSLVRSQFLQIITVTMLSFLLSCHVTLSPPSSFFLLLLPSSSLPSSSSLFSPQVFLTCSLTHSSVLITFPYLRSLSFTFFISHLLHQPSPPIYTHPSPSSLTRLSLLLTLHLHSFLICMHSLTPHLNHPCLTHLSHLPLWSLITNQSHTSHLYKIMGIGIADVIGPFLLHPLLPS